MTMFAGLDIALMFQRPEHFQLSPEDPDKPVDWQCLHVRAWKPDAWLVPKLHCNTNGRLSLHGKRIARVDTRHTNKRALSSLPILLLITYH